MPVAVDILADVLEIEDERWRGAVEGYLNNQKFYFLVEPAYYEQALRIYNKLKWEKSLNAYGLVDIGTLREREHIDPQSGSLAEKVETGNALARTYMDYLLGRVMCCDTVEQLRGYRTAITDEGMLYQAMWRVRFAETVWRMRSSAVMRSRCVSLVWRRRPLACRPRFRTGNPSGRQFLSRKRPC